MTQLLLLVSFIAEPPLPPTVIPATRISTSTSTPITQRVIDYRLDPVEFYDDAGTPTFNLPVDAAQAHSLVVYVGGQRVAATQLKIVAVGSGFKVGLTGGGPAPKNSVYIDYDRRVGVVARGMIWAPGGLGTTMIYRGERLAASGER